MTAVEALSAPATFPPARPSNLTGERYASVLAQTTLRALPTLDASQRLRALNTLKSCYREHPLAHLLALTISLAEAWDDYEAWVHSGPPKGLAGQVRDVLCMHAQGDDFVSEFDQGAARHVDQMMARYPRLWDVIAPLMAASLVEETERREARRTIVSAALAFIFALVAFIFMANSCGQDVMAMNGVPSDHRMDLVGQESPNMSRLTPASDLQLILHGGHGVSGQEP